MGVRKVMYLGRGGGGGGVEVRGMSEMLWPSEVVAVVSTKYRKK